MNGKNKGPVKDQIFKYDGSARVAIQFNGMNGNDVAEFINDATGNGSATNRGSWVSAFLNEDSEELAIRKYDFVVSTSWIINHPFRVCTFEEFIEEFEIKDSHVIHEPLYYQIKRK